MALHNVWVKVIDDGGAIRADTIDRFRTEPRQGHDGDENLLAVLRHAGGDVPVATYQEKHRGAVVDGFMRALANSEHGRAESFHVIEALPPDEVPAEEPYFWRTVWDVWPDAGPFDERRIEKVRRPVDKQAN